MTDVLVDFEPFELQVPPLLSEKQIVGLVTGARGGKTQSGVFRTIMDAIEQPGFWSADARKGQPYTIAVGAPTFPMLQRIILPAFQAMIPRSVVIGRYHETRKRLKVRGLKGETHIYFLSGKAFESWMGLKLYRVWLDEFAQVKEALFDEILVRLSDRKGRLLLTGTPQGPNWAYHRIYKPWAAAGGNEGHEEIDFFTWKTTDNPHIDREFIEKKRRSMPARFFRRTFEATWETFEGQIYEEFLEAVHCRERSEYKFRLPNGRTVGTGNQLVPLEKVLAGVDWGFGAGHAGVILVGAKDTAGRWWLLEESVAEGVLVAGGSGVDSWVNRARAMMARWHVSKFYCDTASPESIQQFKRAGIPARFAVKDVTEGIQAVAKALHVDEEVMEAGLVVMSDMRDVVDEFTYYHWMEGKEKPVKVQDNCMDAVRYMIYTEDIKGRFKREPQFAG